MADLYDLLLKWGAGPGTAVALVSIALKAALLLLIALAAAVFLRAARPAIRHLTLTMAMVAVLALPVLTVALPEWSLAAFSGGAGAATAGSVETTGEGGERLVFFKDGGSTRVETNSAAGLERTPARSQAFSSGLAALDALRWMPVAVAIWACGAAVILLYILIGSVGMMRLVAAARPVRAESWMEALDEVSDRLSIRRPVQLLVSDRISVPIVWGTLRPQILLPDEALNWEVERQRCVLAHELAHVRRMDTLTQSLAGIACALHWPNPLVWKAAGGMRRERERACDQHVLAAARTKPSRYATHLIEIAQRTPVMMAAPIGAVAMARRTQLEGRILSILDAPDRTSTSRWGSRAVAAVALLVVFPIAAFELVPEPVALAPAVEMASSGLSSRALVSRSDDVIEQVFSVRPGGLLTITSDQGNIEVRTGTDNQVRLEVHRTPRGRASVDEFTVSSEQHGDEVRIRGTAARRRGGNEVNVRFVVNVPPRFDLSLKTGGGNISIEDLNGDVRVETSGGNLMLGRIVGTVRGQTSGGNIRLHDTEGDVDVQTSGGEVRIGRVAGRVRAQTSGGNINVDGAEGDLRVSTSGGNVRLGPVNGSVEAQTSGGNIDVDGVGGRIDAQTSGGSVTARITAQPSADGRLKTNGGSVTVYLAEGIGVDLEADAHGGRVQSDLPVVTRGNVREDRLQGTIGGGGPRLVLEGDFVHVKRL